MGAIEKFNLKGNLAIVTGGAGLLGKKHTEALLEASCDVVIFDINEKALAAVKEPKLNN